MHSDDHHQWDELASAAADGELGPDETAAFADHIDRCERCRDAVAAYERLRRRCLIHPASDATASDRLEDAVLASWSSAAQSRSAARTLVRRASLAAAAAACLALVFSATVLGRSSSTDTRVDRARAGEETITTRARSFDRRSVEVEAGSTVEWRNTSDLEHLLVRRIGGTTVRTPLQPGEDQEVTFDEPGTYEVRCEIHPAMVGTVTVDA